LTL
ncbi:hypothetical protein BN1723_019227, partial [Verticillium longisporum]|jgi:hypothetical protein